MSCPKCGSNKAFHTAKQRSIVSVDDGKAVQILETFENTESLVCVECGHIFISELFIVAWVYRDLLPNTKPYKNTTKLSYDKAIEYCKSMNLKYPKLYHWPVPVDE